MSRTPFQAIATRSPQSILELFRIAFEFLERKRGSHTLIVTISGVLLGAIISGWWPLFQLCTEGYFKWWPFPFATTCEYFPAVSFLVAFLLLLYGHQYFDPWIHRKLLELREINPRVGIISDLGQSMSGETASWTETSPTEWRENILKRTSTSEDSVLIKEINVGNEVLHSNSVILNPYGGVYPETDIRGNNTLESIFEYVEEGGVFINIADFPFYWAYSIQQNRRISQSRIEYFPHQSGGFQAIRPISAHPVVTDYGIPVVTIPDEDAITISHNGEEFRVVRVLGGVENVEEILTAEYNGQEVHAAGRLRYGEGYFIFFLISLTQEGGKTLESLIIDELLKIL